MREKINRPEYLDKLISFQDKDVIKIITGIRRCGKSTLLDLFEAYLEQEQIPKSNIHHMNLESMKYRKILNDEDFYDYVADQMVKDSRNYLLFDELQEVTNWEKAIESFRLDFDVDIYITGSNAHLLSTEFSTLLSGRYVEIRMLPLSFKEFLTFYDFRPELTMDEKFQKYLQIGGMPILKQFDFDLPRINDTLEGIYSTVILRDVLERNNATDHALMNRLVRFLADTVGCITSPNNIGTILLAETELNQSKNKAVANVAGKTVDKYIHMLMDAFIFYSVGRYDIKGKQLLKTLGKNYIIDMGFRNMLLGYRDADRGHILENIIFLELLRRDYRISIGKYGETEVDFVCEKPDRKMYIQVTESLSSESVKERELRPLRLIPDNYEKIVLTMDRTYIKSYDGISIINIIDFLLS